MEYFMSQEEYERRLQQEEQEKQRKSTEPNSSSSSSSSNGSVFFIGNATTIINFNDTVRILTDPNFLHAGDHVHLGVLKDPIVPDLGSLPPVDVEAALSRDVPIVTTPHAKACLTEKKPAGEGFNRVVARGGVEGHVPPGPLAAINELLGAVPPTNGWLVELGWLGPGASDDEDGFETGYRIYISGDTLMVDELKEIPERLRGDKIDLMLVHLGGTTIPGPNMPLLMVTMDAVQGVQLMRLVDPDVTVPIHFDDYDVFCSSLDDFKEEVKAAGFGDRVVYLDRGDEYKFAVRQAL
ncbi:hypothetical protein NEMBOFW57_007886 [Staphylotrichum longicolle]|uniref:Metallo-beta-lactamase domain-containing protein n=1 Tax=Staphylotrichum longicolle TaxID=669026 RepID=A0AAD4EVX8_9PEZI|nr:hypothetical protein NEMBOFW57_007886 [Staphylotrichum longicolle]